MKTLLISLFLLVSPLFADQMSDMGIEKIYHFTYTTLTKKCSLDVVVLKSGKVKTERICFNLTK